MSDQGDFSIRLPHRKQATPRTKAASRSRTPTPVCPCETECSKKKVFAIYVASAICVASFFTGFYFLAMRKAANLAKCPPPSQLYKGMCIDSSRVAEYKIAYKASKYVADVEGDCYFTRKLPTPDELEQLYEGLNMTLLESEPMFNAKIVDGKVTSTKPDYKILCPLLLNDAKRRTVYGFLVVLATTCVIVISKKK